MLVAIALATKNRSRFATSTPVEETSTPQSINAKKACIHSKKNFTFAARLRGKVVLVFQRALK